MIGDVEEGLEIVTEYDMETHDIIALTKFIEWSQKRGRVISETSNLTSSEFVNIGS